MSLGALRILYVTDQRVDQALAGIAIDKNDLDIWLYNAHSTQHALNWLEGTGDYADRLLQPFPDLVMLDLGVSLASGLDLLTQMKSSNYASVPVVVFSSPGWEPEIEQALKLGADIYVEKPSDFKELPIALRSIYEFGMQKRAIA
jgi:two-component system response regulator